MNTAPKTVRNALLFALGALLPLGVGCSAIRKLPPLKAAEIHTSTSVMGYSAEADALGVSITDRTLKAEHVQWRIKFPGFSHETSAKSYQQTLPKEVP